MPLLVSAFAWHLTPDAHTGSPPCCQAAGDSSSRWKTGGGGWLVVEELVEDGGGGGDKNTLYLKLHQKSLFVSRSEPGQAGGGMTQYAPTRLFHRQW